MNDSLSPSRDDLALGHKVITIALNVLAWGTTMAIAWSCSTLLMGIIMFIIMSIVMGLLMGMLRIFLMFKLPATTVAGIGGFVGGTAARVTSLFTRKVAA